MGRDRNRNPRAVAPAPEPPTVAAAPPLDGNRLYRVVLGTRNRLVVIGATTEGEHREFIEGQINAMNWMMGLLDRYQ